jgi:hypothetical protein
MVVPCTAFPVASVAHAAHKSLLGTKKTLLHAGRHIWHKVHHAVHTVATKPQLLISTACRRLPGALAVIALGVMPPTSQASGPHSVFSPTTQPTVQSPEGDSTGIGAGIGSADGSLPATSEAPSDLGPAPATAALASTIITMPYNDVLSPSLPTQDPDRHPAGSYPIAPAFQAPAADFLPVMGPAQSVPEPSSLVILAAALCGARLIKRRSSGALCEPAGITHGRPRLFPGTPCSTDRRVAPSHPGGRLFGV